MVHLKYISYYFRDKCFECRCGKLKKLLLTINIWNKFFLALKEYAVQKGSAVLNFEIVHEKSQPAIPKCPEELCLSQF